MKIFVLCFVTFLIEESLGKHPVLLVPGDGGSQMEAQFLKSPPHYICGRQDRTFLLWLNLYFMLPVTLDCFVETIKLEYNRTTKRTSSPDFCDVNVPGFGTTDSVSYLSNLKIKRTSYFYYVIDELVSNQGYTANKDIRGAPYDFRKSPNAGEMDEFIRNMKNLIEKMYAENLNKSVIIIGHSLGTLYTHLILTSMSQEWKNKYISTFISVSGPYSGAVDAIRTALSGNNEHIPIINPARVRPAQSSWPSTYYLLPTVGFWPNKTIVTTKQGHFTTNTIIDLLALSKIPNAVDHYKNTNSIPKSIVAPQTSVYCIFSNNIATSEVLDYTNVEFPEDQPNIIHGLGDGTVNLDSLLECSKWKNYQTEKVITHVIPDVTHLAILRDERFISYVSGVIKSINV